MLGRWDTTETVHAPADMQQCSQSFSIVGGGVVALCAPSVTNMHMFNCARKRFDNKPPSSKRGILFQATSFTAEKLF